MKLRFEPNLDYQLQAIEAVCDLFRGQEICRSEFTLTPDGLSGQLTAEFLPNELSIGNRLQLLDDQILANLGEIQLRNGLRPASRLAAGDFTVEMETGTGKTYVYLRTIFELHKRYGFSKFVIVVPSLAIKEGVYKTLQITADHLRGLFANTPFDYFIYDSAKLAQVRNFASSPQIQIMLVTVGAINKKEVNNLYKASEKTGGEKPIDLIKATHPIVIVDEPQSVDGGLAGRGKAALGAMNPLCTLRYSATHVDQHHMLYRLDAVDAYERKLVKQIEVAALQVEGGHNRAYVKLLGVSNKKGVISAQVEIDVQRRGGVRRQQLTVQDGDLLELTTNRSIYRDCRIGEIRVENGNAFVEVRVPGGEHYLRIGQAIGDIDEAAIKRQLIRRTIKEHLDKELRLRPQGIKVLSLFFIDKVELYRQYDEAGNPQKGRYAQIFEEEYQRLAHHPDYQTLFNEIDFSAAASAVHQGYFSIDKRKVGTKMVEVFKDTGGDSKADDDTYHLIMRDKEKLLSLATPLKFIFSHSALREGWDNPNIFQICVLRTMHSEQQRRQTIGRGLRLCVNQSGERLRGFAINTLTVIAAESYEQFAENLQKEIEADTGIRFGVVETHQFAALAIHDGNGRTTALGVTQSEAIWQHLQQAGYVDKQGKVQDKLRSAIISGTLQLPAVFQPQLAQISEILRKLTGKLAIKNADERSTIKTRQAVLHSEEFQSLWNRIKQQTTYRIHFDNEQLLHSCQKNLRDAPPIAKTRLQIHKAELTIGRGGVVAAATASAPPVTLDEGEIELPDLLTDLQNRTQLTRRSLVRILTESGRLNDFARNPQQFIELSAETINRSKRLALVDGIKYQRIGDEHYYAQELFEKEELTGYLKNMLPVNKAVHEAIVYDSSGVERVFAEQLEQNEAVKVYAKLPAWFKVPTPLGSYNPDWAVLVEQDGAERIYFVVAA